MHTLWPASAARETRLEDFYAYPPELTEPWVRVNFVSSLDGSASLAGSSRGLSNRDDQRLLGLIRDLSDVVLVGAGTANAEGYHGIRRTEDRLRRRRRHGFTDVAPIAVVTRSCSISPNFPLITDTTASPIVITCDAAPSPARTDLTNAGAEVILAGDTTVNLGDALRELDRRGMRRIGCEGGPRLFGELITGDLVDELCLSVSPMLTGGVAGRIASGPTPALPRGMRLESVLRTDDSMLFLRYISTSRSVRR